MDGDAGGAGAGGGLDGGGQRFGRIGVVDAEAALERDRQAAGVAHRAQALLDPPRPRHHAGAEAGGGRAAGWDSRS